METKKIIWNDNILTDNYEMSFINEDGNLPSRISLINKDDDVNNPPEKWRFDFVSRQYVDEHNQIQDNRLSEVERVNEEQNNRLTEVERVNEEQNNRLTEVERVNTEQNNRLTEVERVNTEQNSLLTEHEERLNAIDGLNGTQNGRLNTAEENITRLQADVQTINTEINTHVSKLCEYRTNKDFSNLNKGIYLVTANLAYRRTNTTHQSIPMRGVLSVRMENGVKKVYGTLHNSDELNGSFADCRATVVDNNVNLSTLTTMEEHKQYNSLDLVDLEYIKLDFEANANNILTSAYNMVTTSEEVKSLSDWIRHITKYHIEKSRTKDDIVVSGIYIVDEFFENRTGELTGGSVTVTSMGEMVKMQMDLTIQLPNGNQSNIYTLGFIKNEKIRNIFKTSIGTVYINHHNPKGIKFNPYIRIGSGKLYFNIPHEMDWIRGENLTINLSVEFITNAHGLE